LLSSRIISDITEDEFGPRLEEFKKGVKEIEARKEEYSLFLIAVKWKDDNQSKPIENPGIIGLNKQYQDHHSLTNTTERPKFIACDYTFECLKNLHFTSPDWIFGDFGSVMSGLKEMERVFIFCKATNPTLSPLSIFLSEYSVPVTFVFTTLVSLNEFKSKSNNYSKRFMDYFASVSQNK